MPIAARLRSLLPAVVMAALLLPAASAPAEAVVEPAGCAMSGAGTAESPFLVATGDDLACIDGNVSYWGSHFAQTADVYLSGAAWTHGIGTEATAFTGAYDGGDFTINGLALEPVTSYQGLFGNVANAAISNVRVNGTIVIDSPDQVQWVGGLAGWAAASTLTDVRSSVSITARVGYAAGYAGIAGGLDWNSSTLTDAWTNGDLDVTVKEGNAECIGGVVGCGYAGTLVRPTASGVINVTISAGVPATSAQAQAMSVGGILGFGQGMTITDASATVDITVNNTTTGGGRGTASAIGGIAGYPTQTTISGAVASGTIDATTTDWIDGIGGLLGAETETAVTESHAGVTITATSGGSHVWNAGGLVGIMYAGSLARVSSDTTLTTSGPDGATSVGGLVGDMFSNSTPPSITDAYARGSISAPGGTEVGGFIGYTVGGTISRAYTTVSVSGATIVGGFAGDMNSDLPTTITASSFFDTQATGLADDTATGEIVGIVGTDTATMRQRATYATGGGEGLAAWTSAWAITAGWAAAADSTDTWGICAAYNDGYPFLLWEVPADPCFVTLAVDAPSNGTITGTGIDCPGTCEAQVAPGAQVELTATADSGYQFDAWTGQCAGEISTTCSFVMEPGATAGATFLPIAPSFTTQPRVLFRTGVILPTGIAPAIPVALSWGATAAAGTITKYEVWRCSAAPCADGSWVAVTLASATATSVNSTVPSARKFSFRIKATASTGAWTMIEWPPTAARVVQQSNTAVKYAGTWTSVTGAGYSGGSLKWSKAARATATFTFTGTQVALVTSKAALRGKVVISVDGKSAVTVDLRGATANRVVAWRWTGSYGLHKVVVRVLGTAGRPRVDLDAFLSYNPGPPLPVAPDK